MNNAKELSSNISAELGSVNISLAVLESIATKAASEVKGVSVTKSNLQKEAGGFIGLMNDRLKTSIKQVDGEIIVDLSIIVKFGYQVPQVALAVQDRVKEQILYMTDIEVSQVNVHIESIEAEKTGQMASLDGDFSD